MLISYIADLNTPALARYRHRFWREVLKALATGATILAIALLLLLPSGCQGTFKNWNPIIHRVSANHPMLAGRPGMYYPSPFDFILIADNLSPHEEWAVLEHETHHWAGDNLGETPVGIGE